MKKVRIIGSGFAGLSAACSLAQKGFEVTIHEKNESIGGRARQFKTNGFTFDMGPSWYWMPDVFEQFFSRFGYSVDDFFELKKLDPGFNIFYGKDNKMPVPANINEVYDLFEQKEPGSSDQLKKFLKEAAYKYEVGINDLVYQPGLSFTEFIDMRLLKSLFKMGVFSSFSKHVRKHFSHPELVQLMEFPVLFLGAMPKDTPALYSLMNYSAISQGTFYPMGGMFEIVNAMAKVAINLGVRIETSSQVDKIIVENEKAVGLEVNGERMEADYVIGAADYHHVEQHLLEEKHRQYSEKYWDSRTFAPSSLIFYLGVDKKIKNLDHHNLFFDEDFDQHAVDIYKKPAYPKKPLFYVCCPSKTDESVAPEGKENMFVLIPLAPGLEDGEEYREELFNHVMDRLEHIIGDEVRPHISYKKSYSVNNFIEDYNAYKGNAYGLANTLFQTAMFKPKIKSPKVENLYYSGQLTTPGPGVPPSLISGIVVSDLIEKKMTSNSLNNTKKATHESVV
jgi:phytoene desaturase